MRQLKLIQKDFRQDTTGFIGIYRVKAHNLRNKRKILGHRFVTVVNFHQMKTESSGGSQISLVSLANSTFGATSKHASLNCIASKGIKESRITLHYFF